MSDRNKLYFSFLNILSLFKTVISKFIDIKENTDETRTITEIKENVEFRNARAWTLVFAIFIASIGLNTNSTAVIIGAMLISPLMGPIVGAGLSLGINDFDLFKKSLTHLLFAVLIGLITSFFYFLISPMTGIQSEILARTNPTVYDVLIAFFGGATGIVAASQGDKGNAIPGVAIATALMPPLCTAGFGLANGKFSYFFGAFYLFAINCIFICFATFLVVRYLKFQRKTYLDIKKQKTINRLTFMIPALFLLPSVFLAYTFIHEASFYNNARDYLKSNFNFPNTHVLKKEFIFDLKKSKIEVTLVGDTIAHKRILEIKRKLKKFHLPNTTLVVHQTSIAEEIENKLKHQFEDKLRIKESSEEAKINLASVSLELDKYKKMVAEYEKDHAEYDARKKDLEFIDKSLILEEQLNREVKWIFPNITKITLGNIKDIQLQQNLPAQNRRLILVESKKSLLRSEKKKVASFFSERLNDQTTEVFLIYKL